MLHSKNNDVIHPGRWFLPSALSLALVLAGCGGSSNGDDDNGEGPDNGNGADNGTAATECDTGVNPATGTDGLTSDAGVETVQVFAFGDALCGFDPNSGDVFTYETGLTEDEHEGVEAVLVDAQSGGSPSEVQAERVIYTAGNENQHCQ